MGSASAVNTVRRSIKSRMAQQCKIDVQRRLSKTSIAVMGEGDVTQVVKDLQTAEDVLGASGRTVHEIKVGNQGTDTSGVDEWDLDTQISSGIAQTVKHLYLYDTTSLSDSDTAFEYSKWVNDDETQAGNSSFGEPETLAYADGAMALDDEEFNQAASQGMTMFASTGDSGSGCPVLSTLVCRSAGRRKSAILRRRHTS